MRCTPVVLNFLFWDGAIFFVFQVTWSFCRLRDAPNEQNLDTPRLAVVLTPPARSLLLASTSYQVLDIKCWPKMNHPGGFTFRRFPMAVVPSRGAPSTTTKRTSGYCATGSGRSQGSCTDGSVRSLVTIGDTTLLVKKHTPVQNHKTNIYSRVRPSAGSPAPDLTPRGTG